MVRDDDTPTSAANSAIAEHVLEAYRNSGLYCVVKGQHMWVACPFHGNGEERTGSMRVNLSDPRFKPAEAKCFACSGKNVYSWNELAKARGLAPLAEGGDADDLWLKLPTANEFYGRSSSDANRDGNTIVLYPRPRGPWRGIKASLMEKIGAKQIQSADGVRIFLPTMVGGVMVGYVSACPTGENMPKYIISPGSWANTALYPLDLVMPMAIKAGYVVLVEGQRDALRLIQFGVPALCTFGTNNIGIEKVRTIRMMRVLPVIAMDADSAGDGARTRLTDMLGPKLKPLQVRFHHAGGDPGSLKKSEILELKAMLERAAAKRS